MADLDANNNAAELMGLVRTSMPFGKYKGTLLADLPVYYLEWFARKGMPKGKLGTQLDLVLTLKSNGLDHILRQLKDLDDGQG